jgi:hypothetical protein
MDDRPILKRPRLHDGILATLGVSKGDASGKGSGSSLIKLSPLCSNDVIRHSLLCTRTGTRGWLTLSIGTRGSTNRRILTRK